MSCLIGDGEGAFLHFISYSQYVLKWEHVAKAIIANSHSKHLIKPLGSCNTRVSMTFVPMGCKKIDSCYQNITQNDSDSTIRENYNIKQCCFKFMVN